MPFVKGKSGNPNGRKKGVPNKPMVSDIVRTQLLKDLIGSFKKEKYYVYKHYYKEEVVYIGKGKNGRAWSGRRSNKKHIDIMNEIEVVICCGDLCEGEAFAIEKSLIKYHNPIYNTYNTV